MSSKRSNQDLPSEESSSKKHKTNTPDQTEEVETDNTDYGDLFFCSLWSGISKGAFHFGDRELEDRLENGFDQLDKELGIELNKLDISSTTSKQAILNQNNLTELIDTHIQDPLSITSDSILKEREERDETEEIKSSSDNQDESDEMAEDTGEEFDELESEDEAMLNTQITSIEKEHTRTILATYVESSSSSVSFSINSSPVLPESSPFRPENNIESQGNNMLDPALTSEEDEEVFYDADNTTFETDTQQASNSREENTQSHLCFSVENAPATAKAEVEELLTQPVMEMLFSTTILISSDEEEDGLEDDPNKTTESNSNLLMETNSDLPMEADSDLPIETNSDLPIEVHANLPSEQQEQSNSQSVSIDQPQEDVSRKNNELSSLMEINDSDISLDENSQPETPPVFHASTQYTPTHWLDDMPKSIGSSSEHLVEPVQFKSRQAFSESVRLKMWWYDAYEQFYKGSVYIFGKTFNEPKNKYESCCILLQGISREIYILPRQYKVNDAGEGMAEKVTLNDLKAELNELLKRKGIFDYTLTECKRKYAFGTPDIPSEAIYIKLCYSYKDYELPNTLSGNTFSHIFGASTGPLEHFIIKKDVMGPCWLDIQNVRLTDTTQSWCALNGVSLMDNCSVADQGEEMPPLTVLSLNLKTRMNRSIKSNEIIAASGFVRKNVSIQQEDKLPVNASCFTFLRLLPNTRYIPDAIQQDSQSTNHHVYFENSEEALLNGLLSMIHRIDPDIIVGHNFLGISLNILLHRMKHYNIDYWHKIGRLRTCKWPKLSSGFGSDVSSLQERRLMSGRIVCDTFVTSKDLIKSKSYDLTELASSQLHIVREDIKPDDLEKHYETGEGLLLFVKHCLYDAYLSYRLMTKMNVLPLTKQLTNLSGNLWSHTLYGARLERNEYLLLHTFYRKNYICPDKTFREKRQLQLLDQDLEFEAHKKKETTNSESNSFVGGLVLDPKVGLYDDYVLLLDFNSLYPTIMQEFNVCFTSMRSDQDRVFFSNESMGVLPELVSMFIERRKKIKQLMKAPGVGKAHQSRYEIEQMALKLTANSMYGSLGSSVSRFQAKSLAMFITEKGREILQSTVDLAKEMGLDVIYGDTDSVMINTHQKKLAVAKAMGELFKRRVNRHHRLLEIGIDGVFRRTLLSRKKKYASLVVTQSRDGHWQESMQVKGFDLVRRDWCSLSHDVSEYVLKTIFFEPDQKTTVDTIHQYLKTVAQKAKAGEYAIHDYIIRKQLTKSLEEYSGSRSNPHVMVAKEMRRAGRMVRVGDTISYVMCKQDSKSSPPVARMIDDVLEKRAEIDIEWYLKKQILPPVYRLCQPIQGTDIQQLTAQLGLDMKDLVQEMETMQLEKLEKEEDPDFILLNDINRYSHIEPPTFECFACSHLSIYTGPIQVENGHMVSGLTCSSCHSVMNAASIWCQVRLKIESLVEKCYNRILVCSNKSCDFYTRNESETHCLVPNCNGNLVPEISDRSLYNQLCYLSQLFDYPQAREKVPDNLEDHVSHCQSEFAMIKQRIDQFIEHSNYRFVNISWAA